MNIFNLLFKKKKDNPFLKVRIYDKKLEGFDICTTCNTPFKLEGDNPNVLQEVGNLRVKGTEILKITCKKCKTEFLFKNFK